MVEGDGCGARACATFLQRYPQVGSRQAIAQPDKARMSMQLKALYLKLRCLICS